jgi:hypothetical protein
VRKGELEVGRYVEYLADALLAPLNVDLNYQRQIIGIPTERINSELPVLVPCK